MMAGAQINPAWLKASHLCVILGPGVPSIDGQLQADRDAQAQAIRTFPKAERRQFSLKRKGGR